MRRSSKGKGRTTPKKPPLAADHPLRMGLSPSNPRLSSPRGAFQRNPPFHDSLSWYGTCNIQAWKGPFDTVEGPKLTWTKHMTREAFLVTSALGVLGTLAVLAGPASAQISVHERKSPFEIQKQPPVYLKSLTSTREKELEGKRDLETDVLVDATIDRVSLAIEKVLAAAQGAIGGDRTLR